LPSDMSLYPHPSRMIKHTGRKVVLSFPLSVSSVEGV
jgi:hypothetical protein